MAGTGEGKKEEADYKRLHSFPLIRVGQEWHSASGRDRPDQTHQLTFLLLFAAEGFSRKMCEQAASGL